ncbi:hypothetical protein KAR91_15955 [Candidatus Pacearchaeota archaeon]|nr:hypothetical protein [Candidatus Pacearchaeota archaeon]
MKGNYLYLVNYITGDSILVVTFGIGIIADIAIHIVELKRYERKKDEV